MRLPFSQSAGPAPLPSITDRGAVQSWRTSKWGIWKHPRAFAGDARKWWEALPVCCPEHHASIDFSDQSIEKIGVP